MASRLFLHIGQHKAGSSTIQAFLVDNAEALKSHGYSYPEIGRGTALTHIAIAASVSTRRDKDTVQRGSAEELADHIRTAGDTSFVVSAEAFETLRTPEVRELGRLFEGIPTTIILYVRNTPGRIQSRYAQLGKNALIEYDFDEFFTRTTDNLSIMKVVERWTAVFGWDALRVGIVDSFTPGTPDLLHDFLAKIEFPDPQSLSFSQTSKNISPGWKTLEALRTALTASSMLQRSRGGGLAADKVQKVRRLVADCVESAAKVAWPSDPKTNYLTPEQFDIASRIFSADLAALNAQLPPEHRITADMPAYSRPRTFLPEYAAIPEEERNAFVAALAAEFAARPQTRTITFTATPTAVLVTVPEPLLRGEMRPPPKPPGERAARPRRDPAVPRAKPKRNPNRNPNRNADSRAAGKAAQNPAAQNPAARDPAAKAEAAKLRKAERKRAAQSARQAAEAIEPAGTAGAAGTAGTAGAGVAPEAPPQKRKSRDKSDPARVAKRLERKAARQASRKKASAQG